MPGSKHPLALVAAILLLVSAGEWRANADSRMVANDHFGVTEHWSTDGGYMGTGITLAFGHIVDTDQWWLAWSGQGWNSFRDYPGNGSCCGLGTHVRQQNFASGNAVAYFTEDGNMLLLDGSTVFWQTFTGGNYGGFLNLQGDANLVVYNADSKPLWSLF